MEYLRKDRHCASWDFVDGNFGGAGAVKDERCGDGLAAWISSKMVSSSTRDLDISYGVGYWVPVGSGLRLGKGLQLSGYGLPTVKGGLPLGL